MNSTSITLSKKSENLVDGIRMLIGELKKTNDEIVAQMQANEQAAAQFSANIDMLQTDNDTLAVLKADNEVFISKVEEILGE